jgi:hypothetical protein
MRWINILVILLIAGCGTTPEQLEEHRYQRELRAEQKAQAIAYCEKQGLVYYLDERSGYRGRWSCITSGQVRAMLGQRR